MNNFQIILIIHSQIKKEITSSQPINGAEFISNLKKTNSNNVAKSPFNLKPLILDDIHYAKPITYEQKKIFITNLGKCTQIDARIIPNEIYKEYLSLLFKEIDIIKPKIIITFRNQVS